MNGFGGAIISYDVVCSLGERCMVAHQMRLNGLRSVSNPYDWMITHNLSAVVDSLLNQGNDFFPKERLVMEDEGSEHLKIVDAETGFICLHEFRKSVSFDEEYSVFAEKYNRRWERLLIQIAAAKSILFVRTNVANEEIPLLLKSQQLNPKARMDFLIINTVETEDVKRIPSGYENVYIYEISNQPDVSYDVWMGNHAHWKEVLAPYKAEDCRNWLEEGLSSIGSEKKLVVWGFGGAGKKLLAQFRAIENLPKIEWFVDHNPNKWGTVDGDLEVKEIESLEGHNKDVVVLICIYGDITEIEKQLKEMDFPDESIKKVVYDGLAPVRIE